MSYPQMYSHIPHDEYQWPRLSEMRATTPHST